MVKSKFESISKQTTLKKKLDKVTKSKQTIRTKSLPSRQPIRNSLQLKPLKKKKSTETQKPVSKSSKLKHVEKLEIPIEIDEEKDQQQEVIPQVFFGTASPFVQSVVLCHILSNNLSLFEQIQIRGVCRLWHYNVKHIWNKSRSLVLTIKDHSIKPKLSADSHEPRPKLDCDHFNSQTMAKGVELAIGRAHWTTSTIDLLGDLFRNVEHLTIFYELSCLFDTTEKLGYFLQKFKKVKSFSFIMPPRGTTREDFMIRLFKIVNDHLAPLNSLQIYLPYYDFPFKPVPKEHYIKTLPFLQNFSLNCSVENLGEMLKMMGISLPAHFPIQSLSINVRHEESLNPISTLLEQNPKLSQIKRLELTGVLNRSMISDLLDHFTQLECLYLSKCPSLQAKMPFTNDWIQIVSKLSHLNELHLWNFQIQLYKDRIAVTLPNIRKLTVVCTTYSLHIDVRYQYEKVNMIDKSIQPPWLVDQEVEHNLKYGQYLHSFARQFPKVEQLTLRHFDIFEKDFSDWCYGAFRHLKSLRLFNGKKEITFN